MHSVESHQKLLLLFLSQCCNHVNGGLLTENLDAAQGAFGSHIVIPVADPGIGSGEGTGEGVAGGVAKQEAEPPRGECGRRAPLPPR